MVEVVWLVMVLVWLLWLFVGVVVLLSVVVVASSCGGDDAVGWLEVRWF